MAQKGFINRKAASPGGHLLSPENPKAVATGPRSIRLNWEPPPGNPMGYKVREISLIRPWNNIYQTHWLLIGHSHCRSEQISLNHAWFFWLLCTKKTGLTNHITAFGSFFFRTDFLQITHDFQSSSKKFRILFHFFATRLVCRGL